MDTLVIVYCTYCQYLYVFQCLLLVVFRTEVHASAEIIQ